MLNASDSVVEQGVRRYGRFASTPRNANPTDEFTGLARRWADFRTKEWAGFTITHPELYSSMIIQDAKYLASSEMYIWDRATRGLVQHAGNVAAGALRLPSDLLHSHVDFAARGYAISYDFSDARIVVDVDIAAKPGAPALSGRLLLDPSVASKPLVVSSQLPAGGTMYTNKIIYPAAGELRAGEREYVFDPARDFAILDEHKSRLPYRTDWTWGTFAMPTPQGYVGANFALRPHLAGQEEESCLWLPGIVEPLSDISFEPQGLDPLGLWRIRSADGRLDLTFAPEGRKDVNHNFGVVAIEYHQIYGLYRGTVSGADRTWEIPGVHGVCERMHARL